MRNDSISEKISAATTTAAKFQIKRPKNPSRKKKGRNTSMVVMTEVVTGPTMMMVPSMAA